MAFNEQEKQIIEWGKANNKSRQDVERAILRFRTGQVMPKKQEIKGVIQNFKETITDIPSDIKETFINATDATAEGMNKAKQIASDVMDDKTSLKSGVLQTIGAGLDAGAKVVGEAVLGLGKLFMSPKAEELTEKGIEKTATALIETPFARNLIQKYDSLPEETKKNIEAVVETGEGLTTMFGFVPVVKKFKSVFSKPVVEALDASDDILRKARNINIPEALGVDMKTLKTGIKDARFAISEIDPQVETVLKRSNFDDVNKHFVDARNAVKNPEKYTPFELVGKKAEDAYDTIDKARSEAVKGKMKILDSVATNKVPGNVINDTMSGGIKRFEKRFGVKIEADGTISPAKGRTSQLDAADERLVSTYFSKLNSLGVSPSVRQVDDFIDWAQSQLYKQSKSVSTLDTASKPAIEQLRAVTGQLNNDLKDYVGGGYAEVNARIAHLINLQDEISRALGADTRKGGGFVKSLFSPTSGNTRQIFDQIRTETGIDLFKEATLAKFAMESMDDVRSRSILKSLDLAVKEAPSFTPVGVLKWLRERADLDGQQLANEFIRRFNVSD